MATSYVSKNVTPVEYYASKGRRDEEVASESREPKIEEFFVEFDCKSWF